MAFPLFKRTEPSVSYIKAVSKNPPWSSVTLPLLTRRWVRKSWRPSERPALLQHREAPVWKGPSKIRKASAPTPSVILPPHSTTLQHTPALPRVSHARRVTLVTTFRMGKPSTDRLQHSPTTVHWDARTSGSHPRCQGWDLNLPPSHWVTISDCNSQASLEISFKPCCFHTHWHAILACLSSIKSSSHRQYPLSCILM